MIKKQFFTILIVSQFIFLSGQAQMKYDFSAIDQLWPIINTLQQDQEPIDEIWETLFKTPGYAALLKYELSEAFFKKHLRLTYKPSMKTNKQELLAANNRYILHYDKLLSYKDSILVFQAQFKNTEIVNQALQLTSEYLTPEMLKNAPSTPLAFILFDRDARGGYGPIIFDIIFVLDKKEKATSLFAHELHHGYRMLNMAYDEEKVELKHDNLLQALNWLQQEGIADQVNIPSEYILSLAKKNDEWAINYQRKIDQSPDIIIKLNMILNNMVVSENNLAELGRELVSNIPQSGHPTGDYMVEKIIKYLGKKDLIETGGNPFAFIYLYNIAVKNDMTLPFFSKQVITFLHEIEKQYVKQPRFDLVKKAYI